MEIRSFLEKVVAEKNKRITDEIFLLIQNDKSLMGDYLLLVEKKGLQAVNMATGKGIKEKYSLTNSPSRNKKPTSTLIKSHTAFYSK